MFVFLGSYSGGGGGGSSDDDDSQDGGSTDDQSQTGIDDFGGDGEEVDDSDSGAAAAGAAGAAGAAAGAGAASGAASGAGTGAGTVVEPPEEEDPEEGEDEEESEPESPEIEEPDLEESETEPEDDINEPETEEDTEEEYDFDESDDVEEDTEEEEDADKEDEEDEDEDEDKTVVVVQEVDALSAMSWGVQPVMKRVEECYGEDVEVFYKPAPVREIDPEQEKQKWRDVGQQLGMPVDPSFCDEDPPESTDLVNKAFEAAIQQYRGEDYIRALWQQGVATGHDINDREVLIDLASDLGMDRERFEDDLDEVELESGERDELPFTFMEIQGKPVPKNGRVRYTDFKTQFTFQGIDEQSPQDLQGFVEEHGPVATPEVMEVYGIQRQEAVQRLQDLDSVSSFKAGGERFWYLE
ncbi:DsbA family oxidoreductase [Natronobacterium lacisalsi]|nr:DsbA family protein [Halobiforma lacisalsi]